MTREELLDVVAIAQLKYRYCHRIDTGDYEGWVNLFTEDGTFDYGGEIFQGHDRLLTFAKTIFEKEFDTTAHVVTNPVVDVTGNEAEGRFYLYYLSEQEDGNYTWRHGIYHDEFRQVDGEWRIVSVDSQSRAAGSY